MSKQLPDNRDGVLQRIVTALSPILVVVAAVGILILLLPLLATILAVMLGIVLVGRLVAGVLWLARGRKIWKQMKDMANRSASSQGDQRPRKKVESKVHTEE